MLQIPCRSCWVSFNNSTSISIDASPLLISFQRISHTVRRIMGRLKAPMPVSFLVQDRESCTGMVGSPLHPASEVVCKIFRDYVWRRLSFYAFASKLDTLSGIILKRQSPRSQLNPFILILHQATGSDQNELKPPWLNASAVSSPGYRGSCTAINAPQLPTSLVPHARHSLTSLGLAGS